MTDYEKLLNYIDTLNLPTQIKDKLIDLIDNARYEERSEGWDEGYDAGRETEDW